MLSTESSLCSKICIVVDFCPIVEFSSSRNVFPCHSTLANSCTQPNAFEIKQAVLHIMLTAKRKKIEILFFYFHDNLILQNCLQKVFVVCMPLEQWAGQTLVAKRGLILSDFTRGQKSGRRTKPGEWSTFCRPPSCLPALRPWPNRLNWVWEARRRCTILRNVVKCRRRWSTSE